MIETRFEDYCDGCDELDPTVSRLYSDNHVICTVISCENQERCRRIYGNIKKNILEELERTYNESTR